MLGESGLRRATEMAIVNANYLAVALKDEFGIVYTGETGRVGHEMILDLRDFRKLYGVECADIARRLMDYGFHAPTLSFPVHETLMIEPTESESLAELDRFVESLVAIKRECEPDTRRRSRRRGQSGQDGSPYGAGGLRRYMDSPLWPRAGRVPVTVDSGQQVFPLRDENRWRIRRPQSLLHLRNAVRGRVGRGSRGRPFAFRKRGSRQVCLLEGIPSGIGRVERFRKGC